MYYYVVSNNNTYLDGLRNLSQVIEIWLVLTRSGITVIIVPEGLHPGTSFNRGSLNLWRFDWIEGETWTGNFGKGIWKKI